MRVDLPDPASAPELFDNVLPRRVVAYFADIAIIALLCLGLALVGGVLGVLTFGLAMPLIPLVVPVVIAGYYILTLGSPARATVGMRMMDIVLTPTRGAPLDGWKILIHPLMFWITVWIAWPFSLAFALFTPRRQMVHDLITGTLMVRHSPMQRHWAGMRGTAGSGA